MRNMKSMIAMALLLCMVLSLCACGKEPAGGTEAPQTQGTEPQQTTENTADTTAAAEDGKVTYTVTVVDEGGNPISGAMVQLCKDTCYPGVTNESGQAQFSLAEDTYKVSFLQLPNGFAYVDAEEFYFDGDATELTITLKAVA